MISFADWEWRRSTFAFGFALLQLHTTRQLFDMPFGVGGSTQPQGNMNMDQMEAATQEYAVQPATYCPCTATDARLRSFSAG